MAKRYTGTLNAAQLDPANAGKNCKPSTVQKYRGKFPPRCHKGQGCPACWQKYNDQRAEAVKAGLSDPSPLWYVHVNKNTIAANLKHGRNDPVVRFQRGRSGKPTYAHRVAFVEGELAYLDKPLHCGARVVITTHFEPKVVE